MQLSAMTHVRKGICFELDTEKTGFVRVAIVTIVNYRDNDFILFTGNYDLFSFIKKLDGC